MSLSATGEIGKSLLPDAARERHSAGWLAGYVFLVPWLLGFLGLTLGPALISLYLSFTNYPLIGPYHWTGLQNWAAVGQDATFVHSVLFTLEYTAIVTPAIFIVGSGLAGPVRRRPLHGRPLEAGTIHPRAVLAEAAAGRGSRAVAACPVASRAVASRAVAA